jgi:glycosyltransferase involved in cell wall biosynthesis
MELKVLSIIIPVFNEAESIWPLYEKLTSALEKLGQNFEVLLINDGSLDSTGRLINDLSARDTRFKAIHLRRNYGQTAAMMAGIDHATGDILIPMDGDLQNDPEDISKLIDKLNDGFDVVSGWRKYRKDGELMRNFPSRVANRLISWISGVKLHDYGCSLKAYKRDVIKGVHLYGEMHRFIPIYASWCGANVTEIPVNHHSRKFGESKYGLERIFKVVLDMLVVKFLASYSTKPIYVFGGFGLLNLLVAGVTGLYALFLKLFEGVSFISTPLPLISIMLFSTAIMSMLMGLLAELVMRTYYESQGLPVYLVKETRNIDKPACVE